MVRRSYYHLFAFGQNHRLQDIIGLCNISHPNAIAVLIERIEKYTRGNSVTQRILLIQKAGIRIGFCVPPRAPLVNKQADAPATVDRLGRKGLAEALATRLTNLAGADSVYTQSFLVHIDGPWGSGKSTLFEFLKQELRKGFLIVEVNAWREQRIGVQWWILLSALRRAIIEDQPGEWARWEARAWDLRDRASARTLPFAAALIALVAVIVLIGIKVQ